MKEPQYPITVRFLEDEEEWVFMNEVELTSNLEWFDGANPEENAVVTDQLGRPVMVKVEAHELLELKLV